MALSTWLDIHAQDAQGRKATLTFRIKAAALGATTLPTAAKIEAVIDAIFGADVISDAIVTGYDVRVNQDSVPGAPGGAGGSSISTAARVRNEPPDNWLFAVPGIAENNVVFDPTNRNSISTVGAIWTAIRDALTDAEITIKNPETGVDLADTSVATTATLYDGKRSPMRAG